MLSKARARVCCWALLLLLLSGACPAQVSGHFYLEKDTYARGEPVFLYFEIVNTGDSALEVPSGDPYSFCSGFQVTVSNDLKRGSSCAPEGYAGSCLSSSVLVKPGGRRTERILLNYAHQLNQPGDYEVKAARQLSYRLSTLNIPFRYDSAGEVQAQLHFRIDAGLTEDPAQLQILVDQLQSKDEMTRREAARALASLAPRSLEDVFLAFSDNREFRQFAPLALHNLNTPRSIAALAELLVNTEPGTYENLESTTYLAQTGDPQWFPLLREMALKHSKIYNYVAAAAQLGGDDAIPMLLQLMQSSDKQSSVVNAASGFGYTGSRAAVPILLGLLKNPNKAIGQRGVYGLRQLTHLNCADDPSGADPQSQYARWARWWVHSQGSARIYKFNECGDVTPLP